MDSRLLDLFLEQQVADQRHGLEVMRHVARSGVTDPDVLAAAALHDIGKRHSRLGPVGRSVATVLMLARLPMTRRMRRYVDHGELGAVDLERAGAPALVVGFARHHQWGRPHGFPAPDWQTLRAADLDLPTANPGF